MKKLTTIKQKKQKEMRSIEVVCLKASSSSITSMLVIMYFFRLDSCILNKKERKTYINVNLKTKYQRFCCWLLLYYSFFSFLLPACLFNDEMLINFWICIRGVIVVVVVLWCAMCPIVLCRSSGGGGAGGGRWWLRHRSKSQNHTIMNRYR